ncbi:MAG: glycosyltransferase family 2 protein [Proteobacteria bacterium]|nr:glycosyltransferase family 2 protein [Pseudomonadota bacterium]
MSNLHRINETPLLSILIPAYNHPDGVDLALRSLGPLGSTSAVEVIVSDDSTQPNSKAKIKYLASDFPSARYLCNSPPKGAVENWNFLLRSAIGEYCLLLHHDEYLDNDLVLLRVLSMLRNDTSIDAIVLPCRIKDGLQPLRLHMPTWIAELITRRWPGYLLRRNVLGPPSVLILRRRLYEYYDSRFQWLVDVELYYRVLSRKSLNIVFLRGQGITSRPIPTSITKTLSGDIKTVQRSEQALLMLNNDAKTIWLRTSSIQMKLARFWESLAWYGFRIIQQAFHLLHRVASSILVSIRRRDGK